MARFYVGNIPFTATEDELRLFFAGLEITNIKIVIDHETKKPRGFAFVDITKGDAKSVITSLDSKEMGGRTIRVSEAHEKPKGSGREARKRDDRQDGNYGWNDR